MNISILLPDLRGGGAERVNLDLAYEFLRKGHKVQFVLMQASGDLLDEAQAKFSVIDLNCPRARGLPSVLLRYLHQHKPDALLASMWPLSVIAPIVSKIYDRKIIVLISEHAILSNGSRFDRPSRRIFLSISTRLGYRIADGRVAVSDGVAVEMSKLSGMPKEKINVIYNPLRKFPSMENSQSNVIKKTKAGRIILGVGSLTGVKNYSLLIDAFSRLPTPHNLTLFILGEGPERTRLERLIAEKSLSQSVFLPGFVLDVSSWLKAADLFVHTSNSEGFGNVIIEALSFGVPVVSCDCPTGPREILENGRFGRLVELNNSVALSEAIMDALEHNWSKEVLISRSMDFHVGKIASAYEALLIR